MTTIERIDAVMSAQGISAYRLCKDTGLDQGNFSKWRSGIIEPSAKALATISTYLGVSINYLLMGTEDEGNNFIEHPQIPVLGVVPCGVPIEAIEDIIEYVDVVPSMAKDHFGLIAKGDSMYPFICEGDILIIKKTPDVKSGKIAIIKVNGDEATCKKIIYNNGINLVPLNNMYDPIVYSPEQIENLPVTVIGEVVEIRRRFK